jgi:hypothetical protein
MKREPREIVVDGRRMVAVSRRDFERFVAMRRQLGGQGARMRSLRTTLIEMTSFLEALERTLTSDVPSSCQEAEGFPEAHTELVTELRRQVRHARSITRRGHPVSPDSPERPSET